MTKEKHSAGGGHGQAWAQKRKAARLAAVQAVYQLEITGIQPDMVVVEFLQHRLQDEVDGFKLGEVDRELFAELVRGVHAERQDLDDMIAAVLAEGWEVERLERLLRIILEAGAFELAYRQKVPARSVISEYVAIADSFFNGKEPGMVNGMLDRLGRDLRTEEFEAR